MKKIILLAVLLIGAGVTAPMYTERVDAGDYKIVQKLDGDMEVLDTAGWKVTGFVSGITKYREAGIFYFSPSNKDGGSGEESQPINVIFRDGAKGVITGNFQFKLPTDAKTRLQLHRLYGRRYETVVDNLIRKSVTEAIKSSASYFKGEEAYSYGRSAFTELINKQIEKGILATESKQVLVKDAEGNTFMDNTVGIKHDAKGKEIVSKPSKLSEYDVMNIGLTIRDITLDDKTMSYIDKKKEAEFKKIQKVAEAEQSKQEAISMKAQGEVQVAKAKADADAKKQTAVTNAEREKAVAELKAQEELRVAELNTLRAKQESEAVLVKKRADAVANTLLVKAGLTPEQKAEYDMKTKIGVAHELSNAKVPQLIVGGGTNGANPMSAVGIKYLMDINEKLSKSK